MKERLQKRGIVFDIQKYSIHDGPGTRTLVFLKGCPLQCRWCSNPESISRKYQVMFMDDRCTTCGKCAAVCDAGVHQLRTPGSGILQHVIDRDAACSGCGKCIAECPVEALRLAGNEMAVAEVVDEVLQDSVFYWSSGGGVTIGGGEPTAQAEFAGAILAECKEQGLHTAMETCGHTDWETFAELARHTDLFLYDLKHLCPDRHKELTGVTNAKILSNLSNLLANGSSVIVRMPLIAGMNDEKMLLRRTLTFLEQESRKNSSLKGVEVLPYHRLGQNKYKQLGLEYPMDEAAGYDQEELQEIEGFLQTFDLPIQLVRH